MFSRHDREALLVYASLAITLGFLDHRVRRFSQHVVTDFIPSVINGTSGAPAKYRVLMPYAIDEISRRTGAEAYMVFLIVEVVAIGAALVALHCLLRAWFSPRIALAGVAGSAALLPLTFTNTWAHPDTFPDLFLFSLGCLFIVRKRDLALAVVLALGMLNRETIGFLLVLWALERARPPSADVLLRGLAVAAACASVYAGVRWIRGWESYRLVMIGENLAVLKVLPHGFDPYTRVAGYFWLVWLAPAVFFAWRGLASPGAPRFFRSSLITAGLLFVVVWLFAAIIELRVLVPVIPLVLPAAVYYLANTAGESQG